MSLPRVILSLSAIALPLILLPAAARAHESILPEIARLNRVLADDPTNAGLVLRRARLFQLDGNASAALTDYREAHRLDPEQSLGPVDLSDLELPVARHRQFVAERDALLAANPEDIVSLVARAESKAWLGDFPAALEDLDRAIALSKTPAPHLLLARTVMVIATGKLPLPELSAALEQASVKLERPLALEFALVDLERMAGKPDGAIARVQRLLKRFPRSYQLHALRGEIHEEAGDRSTARKNYQRALELIGELAPRRQKQRGVKACRERMQLGLRRLEG